MSEERRELVELIRDHYADLVTKPSEHNRLTNEDKQRKWREIFNICAQRRHKWTIGKNSMYLQKTKWPGIKRDALSRVTASLTDVDKMVLELINDGQSNDGQFASYDDILVNESETNVHTDEGISTYNEDLIETPTEDSEVKHFPLPPSDNNQSTDLMDCIKSLTAHLCDTASVNKPITTEGTNESQIYSESPMIPSSRVTFVSSGKSGKSFRSLKRLGSVGQTPNHNRRLGTNTTNGVSVNNEFMNGFSAATFSGNDEQHLSNGINGDSAGYGDNDDLALKRAKLQLIQSQVELNRSQTELNRSEAALNRARLLEVFATLRAQGCTGKTALRDLDEFGTWTGGGR